MKVIFLSAFSIERTEASGAIEGSKKLFNLLNACVDDVLWYTIQPDNVSLLVRLWRMINGTTFCISKQNKKEIEQLLINENYDVIFYDYAYGSNYIKYLKKKFPNVKILKFFHDVNAYRLKSIIKTKKLFSIKGENKIKFYFYYKGIKKSEKNAVKYSDKVLCLSNRDSDLVKKYYGRSADNIFPVSFENKKMPIPKTNIFNVKNNILFVGLMSYEPNFEACRFFVQKVMPNLPNCNFHIVGSKSFDYVNELKLADNIHIHGRVECLDEYYLSADMVVAPIFSGGGMKVKVCEAMSYGKYIFGTNEAFAGYDVEYDKLGGLCNTADEFVTKIQMFFDKNIPRFNAYARKMFEQRYTNESQISIMKNVLGLEEKHGCINYYS